MGAAVALKVTFGKKPLSSATTLSFHNINLFVVVSPRYSVSLYYSVSLCYVTFAWVTWPERPKAVMDEGKRPEGPSARSQGPVWP